MLYPLKFKPQCKERPWGGERLVARAGKKSVDDKRIGESWEICGLAGDLSVVSEGALKGNNIEELTEVYMGDLVGEKVYDRFGVEFPLLIKLIDAQETLSIQVHPDDQLSAERHNAYGKTEFWYVLEADPQAHLYLGFNRSVSREEYLQADGQIADLLQRLPVEEGDAFYIPAGTVHAVGAGMLLAEIQQTSDITYRISDWGRTDEKGKPRELHSELALDAINFDPETGLDVTTAARPNTPVVLKSCSQFAVNLLEVSETCTRNYFELDSFVILLAVAGACTVAWEGGSTPLAKGESILIPASLVEVELRGRAKLLETYIP